MDTGVFIALINPGMSLIFAAAFFLLWQHRRHRHILVLSVSFLAMSLAFLLQYFTLFDPRFSTLASNFLALAGGIGIAVGGLRRYGVRPPLIATGVLTVVGFGAFAWFVVVDPDITLRIYAINFAFGAITLVMAAELRSVRGRGVIDNLILGIVTVWGVSFFVRPLVVIWFEGPYEGYENFHQSLYWMTLTFSVSIFLLLFALSLITAIALDAIDELKRDSQTDPLSGLLNRRGFEMQAAKTLRTARRLHMPAALVVCDLDHFKSVNDTWGHGCGDRVISAFAECLGDALGAEHVAGRIGGEEFAVLLSGADARAGRLFAEGVRTAFGARPVPSLPGDKRFSASFGVAGWRQGEGIASLFARADDALYAAKKAGRDRVRLASAAQERASAPITLPATLSSAGRHDSSRA